MAHGTAPGAGKGWWRRSKSADIGPNAIDLPGHGADPTRRPQRAGGRFDRRHFETRTVETTARLKNCELTADT
jgi:hypothetical protein